MRRLPPLPPVVAPLPNSVCSKGQGWHKDWHAIDYRYLNKYCAGDAHPLPDIPHIMQRVGKARYISLCDMSEYGLWSKELGWEW